MHDFSHNHSFSQKILKAHKLPAMNFMTIFRISILLFCANLVSTSPTKTGGAVSLNAERVGRLSDFAGKPPSPSFIDYGTFSDEEGQFGQTSAIHRDMDDDNEDWLQDVLAELHGRPGEVQNGSHIAQHVDSNGSEVQGGASGASGSASVTYGESSGPGQMMQNVSPQTTGSSQLSNHYNQQQQQQQQQHMHNSAQQQNVPTHNWTDGTHLGGYSAAGSTMVNVINTPDEMSPPPEDQRWAHGGDDHVQSLRHHQQQMQQQQQQLQHMQQQQRQHNQHQHEQQLRAQNQGEVRYVYNENELSDSQNDYPPGYEPQQPEMPTAMPKEKVSQIWKINLFRKINDNEAFCIECSKTLKCARGSTSGLINHLKSIHKNSKYATRYSELLKANEDASFSMGIHPTEKVLSTNKKAVRMRNYRAHKRQEKQNPVKLVAQNKFANTVQFQSLTGTLQKEEQEGADKPHARQLQSQVQLQKHVVQQAQQEQGQQQKQRRNGQIVNGVDDRSQLLRYDPMHDEANIHSSLPVSTLQRNEAPIQTAAGAGAAKGYAGDGEEQRPSTSANRAHYQMTPATAPIRGGYPDLAAIAASVTAAHGVVVQQANQEPNAANVMAQQMPREKAAAATAETAQNLKRKEVPEAAASQSKQTKMAAATASATQEPQPEKATAMVAAKEQSRGKERPSKMPELPATGPKRIKYVTPLKGRTIILREQEDGIYKVNPEDYKDVIRRLTGNGKGYAPRNEHNYRQVHVDKPKAQTPNGIMDISSDNEVTALQKSNASNGTGTGSMRLETSSDYADQLEHLLLAESHDVRRHHNASNNLAPIVADNNATQNIDNSMDDEDIDYLLAQSHLFKMDHELDDNTGSVAHHNQGNFAQQRTQLQTQQQMPLQHYNSMNHHDAHSKKPITFKKKQPKNILRFISYI